MYDTFGFKTSIQLDVLARVDRKAKINHYPANSVVYFVNTYPLDIIILMYVWVPEVGNTADTPNPPWVLPL